MDGLPSVSGGLTGAELGEEAPGPADALQMTDGLERGQRLPCRFRGRGQVTGGALRGRGDVYRG